MIKTNTLVRCIKSELRLKGISYRALSEQLGISESATKKMFANENFSLHRLDEICGILDMDILELAEKGAGNFKKINQLTVDQELQIVADTKWLIVTYAAVNYWSLADITRRYNITEAEAIMYLLRLERFGLIELRTNNQIRPLLTNNFRWNPGGPAEAFYRKYFLPDFFNSNFDEEGASLITTSGDLSDESRHLLAQRFEQLSEFYQELCLNDRHKRPGNMERKGTSMVLAYRTWTLPIFEELINAD